MSAQPDAWRVSTVEGIFETDLETLKQWIREGCVLPTDKVSKGTLNWIDAGLVPKLKAAFNGEIELEPTSPTNAPPDYGGWQTPPDSEQASTSIQNDSATYSTPAFTAVTCQNHPGEEPWYMCRTCSALWCGDCPRFVGNSHIAVCPSCGDLCHSYDEVRSRAARAEFQGSAFGFGDLSIAIAYPLQHKAALLGGALLYGFLLLAGFRGSLIAWMIMFGCISQAISQITWGRLERSFMPDFSDFSVYENLVQPILLGLGITIVSWGPLILLVLALLLGVISKGVVSPVDSPSQLRTAQQQAPSHEELGVLMDPNADAQQLEQANKKLNELRPGSQIVREAERSEEPNDPRAVVRQLMPLLGARVSIFLLVLVAVAWGVFYYPMALSVAGYTQSFFSVVNPLVGLDTIRRMGATYFKAFGMVLLLQVVFGVIALIVALITSPFYLPFIGNLPANFINGTITFYFNLVIACLLGLSLYKCADDLGIKTD